MSGEDENESSRREKGVMPFSVLVIDSGIGGLSVVQAIRKISPALSVTYLADNGGFPYGALSIGSLTSRIDLLISNLTTEINFDAVVLACNTASTAVLSALRQRYAFPIIGVVPPVKTAGEISVSRQIALLATEGTSGRGYIDDLAQTFAADCQIFRVPCPDLAQQAELKATGQEVDVSLLRSNLSVVSSDEWAKIDTIILGCTHYPFIKEELEGIVGPDKVWLDPALPVARHLIATLAQKETASIEQRSANENAIYFTATISPDAVFKAFLEKIGFSCIRQLEDFVA
ncbi:MAG: glutamate racemase [Sneathiella sp.]